jgi:hypothetical protein
VRHPPRRPPATSATCCFRGGADELAGLEVLQVVVEIVATLNTIAVVKSA